MSSTPHSSFYIVGIGASAGGLDALEQFFRNMPAQNGMAFVVVQHLSPNFKSLMNELLSRHTTMAIHTVTDGVKVEPNSIYLITPRKNMVLANGHLQLTDQSPLSGSLNFPIDIFFNSLAEQCCEQAIGIILSGTGSDGTKGVGAIHKAGGLVLVQTPETSGFDGMPKSAIASITVDLVAPPDQLPRHLLSYRDDRTAFKQELSEIAVTEENELSVVFALLRQRFQVNFAYYKMATILRRLQRRVTFSHSVDLAEYIRRLQTDDDEINSLYRDLLVEVTEFFRDQEAFDRIATEVVPKIVDDANGDQIRVWVPGCATGEEAYSLAMLFDQYCRRYRPDTRVKVFATDIHQKSLELASGGIFPAERVEHLSAELQETYFSPINDGEYRIEKELRQMVIFAPHNLTQDPPFTKLDLISCRNVLIYFRAPTQKKIMSYFHFGLKQGGYLMLGPSEHLNELKDEFSIIDRRWRIYRKQRDVRLLQTPSMGQRRQRPLLSDPLLATTLVEQRLQQGTQNAQLQSWQNKLLEKYVPPSLLVNRNFELKHVFGDAGEYLRQMRGQVTTDVLKMVKSDLHTALRAALHRASRDGESVAYKGIRISAEDGSSHYVELSAEPFASQYDKESYVLVTIEALDEPVQPPPPIEALNLNEASGDQIDLLERELQYTREHLQATVEELETTNEELQSTNEELIASNEELQSTNEELHSVNEELYTVNTEYQHKINELLQVTNDMQNLQNSTQIATIFLDPEHRIRNFTPSAGTTFNLLPQDIGRPIEHLLYNLNLSRNALRTITDDVLQNRTAIDQEVMLPTNHEYLMRVRPYETDANLVAGVVFSFIDIAHSKQVERSQTEQSTLVQKLYDITSHPSTTIQQQLNYALEVATDALGLNMGVISCVEGAVCHMDLVHAPAGEIAVNDAFVFAETYCNVTLSQDGVIAIHHVGTTSWQEHAAYLKFGLETHIGTRVFVNGNCYGALNFSQTEPREVPFTAAERDFVRQLGVWVGSMLELRITNETLKATSAELSTIVHTIHLPIIHLNAERVITFVNAPFLELFGYDNEEVVGQPVRLLYPSDDAYDAWTKKVKGLGASMDRQRINIELRDKGGSTFMVQMIRSALTDANGEVAGYVGIMVETALYRQQAISLAETTRRFEAVFNYASQFIGLVAPDGTLLEANKTALDFANLTRADVINKPFWDALWWQHSPAINQQLRDAIKRAAAGEFMRYPVDVLGVGGHTVTIDFSLNPITDADGKVIYLIPEGRILG